MFDPSLILVGLEIGTSKVCAMVGECNANGSVNIIGVGQARSRSVRKGEIIDPALTEEDIREAIAEAEQMTDLEIRSVYLGVTGSHVRGLKNRGMHPVISTDQEITQEDVHDVVKNAKAINLSSENYVIHAIRQHFIVDGFEGVRNPVGMYGTRLEVDMHVVHANLKRLQNSIRVVKGLQLEVDDIVFNGLGTALSVLNPEQKEMGALVIDLGGGTTEYIVYSGGIVKYTGVLAVGGDHVSNDLAYGLKVPQSQAEQLKIQHGAAIVEETVKGQKLTLPGDVGVEGKPIDLEKLRRVMQLRLEEIFELIRADLEEQDMLGLIRAGVFLCGGGARIPRIEHLANRVLGAPAQMAHSNTVSGLKAALDQPEFATGIGLVKFGSFQQKKRRAKGIIPHSVKQTLGGWFKLGKRFLF